MQFVRTVQLFKRLDNYARPSTTHQTQSSAQVLGIVDSAGPIAPITTGPGPRVADRTGPTFRTRPIDQRWSESPMTGRRHLSAQCRRAVLVEHAADETRRVRAASRSDAGQKSCGPRGRRRRLTAPRALSEPSVALTERTIALSESKLISVRAKFALTELGGALTEGDFCAH